MNERDLPSNNRESLQTFKSVQIMSVDTDEVVSRAHSVGGIQEQNRNRVIRDMFNELQQATLMFQ
eukprot:403337212